MEPNYVLAQAIAANAEDEQEAIKGYYNLLSFPRLSDEDRELINEIIAEEKKHAYMLAIMAMKYDGEVKAEALPEGMHIGWTVTKDEEHEREECPDCPEGHRYDDEIE